MFKRKRTKNGESENIKEREREEIKVFLEISGAKGGKSATPNVQGSIGLTRGNYKTIF